MKQRMLALICGALAALTAMDPAPAQTLDLKRIEAVADSVAHAHLAENVTPGMTVTVARDGQIVFARGYGQADVEMGVAAGPETVYRIGSLTKQFTAAAIMRLSRRARSPSTIRLRSTCRTTPCRGTR